MRHRVWHILLPVCFFTGALSAQWPLFRAHPMDGATRFQAAAAAQDRHGWIWIGGAAGLWRFDGLEYHPAVLPEEASGGVTALLATAQRLWVGFENGRVAFLDLSAPFLPQAASDSPETPASARFQFWQPSAALPKAAVSGLVEDAAGHLWIATYGGGLFCTRQGRAAAVELPGGADIYAIARGEHRQIWAATDAGIFVTAWDTTAAQPSVRRLGKAAGLPDEIVTALLPDPNGGMWVGTYDRGVCRYDYARGRFDPPIPGWPGYHVSALAQFGDSDLWIGTDGKGCLRFDRKAGQLHEQPNARDRIRALFKDREGLLWVLSDRLGLFSAHVRFAKTEAAAFEVQAVLADRRRNLWVGAATGLYQCTGTQWKPMLPQHANIISLAEMPDGRILAGSFGEGLWVTAPGGGAPFRIGEQAGLRNGSILSVAVAGDTVWLATLGGVQYSVGEKWRFQTLPELGAGYVYKIYPGADGRIWFGADGLGLSVLENDRWRRLNPDAGKTIKTVTDICADARGRIWFIAPNAGLWRYDGQNFRHYDLAQQLHSRNILGLERDGDGQLLLLYENGLDILNPETDHIAYYPAGAVLPGFQAGVNAHCTDPDGHAWFAVGNSLLRAAAFGERFTADPRPAITAVSVFMTPVDFNVRRSFAYDQNYLVFHFTGIWYTLPESARYRYRLEGYDLDWKITKDRLASYSNLPPGRYKFRFQSSEHGNFLRTPETAYDFVIQSPFWTRWWFVLSATLLIALLLYAWVRAREVRLQREADLRREKAESQFAALKSQINPHFLFNSFNTLIALIEENPKSAAEYVEHLSDYYRGMMAYREKDRISIREEMNLVENFYFLLKKRFENNFRLRVTLEETNGYILPLTLQMLLENAVKHNIISKNRPLEVEIYLEDKKWIVARNNLQPKNQPEPGTHFGLQSLAERYRLLGNYLVIVEQDACYFTVKVPLIPPL